MSRKVFLFFFIVFLLPFIFAYTGKSMVGELGARVDPGIHIFYAEFEGQGDTTDFLYLDDISLQNISDLTVEIGSTAKIIFLEPVNLTLDVVNGSLDLSANVDLLHNLIFVNSSALTSFQTPAMLFVRDLTFSNPIIFRNGELCPVDMCSFVSYSGGELVFTVENFSTYYIAEDPSVVVTPPVTDGGSSGGGGGGSTLTTDNTFLGYSDMMGSIDDLLVSEYSLVLDVRRGAYFRKMLNLTNNGTRTIIVGINSEEIGKFIVPEVRILELLPGESKEVYFDFYFSDRYPSEVYVGDIIFLGLDGEKRVKTILNVNDPVTLFDVQVDVLEDEYLVGSLVSSDVHIVNNGVELDLPFSIEYMIMDGAKNVIVSDMQDFVIDDSLDVVLSLNLPRYLDKGDYVFYVRAGNDESFVVSSDVFYVYRGGFKGFFSSLDSFEIVILSVVILVILLVVWIFFRYRKNRASLKEPILSSRLVVRKKRQ